MSEWNPETDGKQVIIHPALASAFEKWLLSRGLNLVRIPEQAIGNPVEEGFDALKEELTQGEPPDVVLEHAKVVYRENSADSIPTYIVGLGGR